MATDSSMTVNGNYAPHQAQGYEISERSFDTHGGNRAAGTEFSAPDSNSTTVSGTTSTNADIPKDEVGWYFVEQYYTTLSKNPEKLFLFYTKQSQFVSGTETEKVSVCVGQKAINDRIKELDFQDCKVRVTNVDSQGSRSNIVIQVIGEISNKSAPQRKFTQTFVLAEQANGYFVLNDIFRYILEEDEYEGGEEDLQRPAVEATTGYQEPAEPVDGGELKTLTSSEDVEEQARDAAIVDRELEKAIEEDPTVAEPDAEPVTETKDIAPAPGVIEAEEAPVAVAPGDDDVASASELAESTAPADTAESEKLKEPEPTPSSSPPKSTTPVPATAPVAAPKPAAPKTWANLVAGNRTAAPITPVVPAAPAPSVPATKTVPPVQTQSPTPLATTAPPASVSPVPDPEQIDTAQSSGSEWQTAGPDHSRKQSRPQGNQTPIENSRAYIKNVTEAVDISSLQSALSKIAEIQYIDINRQKNCAFVDFVTPAGYRAAVAANPHEVAGELLYVEERRIRGPGFTGGYARGGPARGGRGDSRPGAPGRGSFQKDGRGSFTGRGRGGVGPRGRGGASQPV